MDCPSCGKNNSKVISVVRWPTQDKRKHECKECGYEYLTTTMLTDDEALLEFLSSIARNGGDPIKNGRLYGLNKNNNELTISLLNKILNEIESLRKA